MCTAKNDLGYDKGYRVPQAGGRYFTALSRSGHSMTTTTRFAPSPTGALHLGHAHAAWFAHRRAREAGGRFLLRIEDIDAGRCRPEHAESIEDDLRWLGLAWDGPVRVQSAHLAEYAAALACLAARGLLYPCFCSRAEVAREIAAAAAAPHGPDGAPLYPGTCRRLGAAMRAEKIAAGLPHAWRLDMAAACAEAPGLTLHDAGQGRIACTPEHFGDVVLGRRDAPASYHLCATHDDAATGVTLVTRGVDLQPAAHLHRLLQQLMGWPETGFAHHPLILDAQGRRLSKRDQAATLRMLRAAGATPAEALQRAGC
jgi:glutamyl-Q tRNA(Asp) synthetase